MKELIGGLELLTNGTETDKLTFLFRVYDIDGTLTLTNMHMLALYSRNVSKVLSLSLFCFTHKNIIKQAHMAFLTIRLCRAGAV